ncbi:hypothetical protein GLOIN_2v1815051 [Rhizophagus irregularis DAOM 181602=DAOM 197198]|nr:hypothetical protein GLOIN_2v1815051 [Rhizophagus irregularis DAOM 181602=DAOM 197198]
MAAALVVVPYHQLPAPVFQWMVNVAIQLIRERCNLYWQFERLAIHNYNDVWALTANWLFIMTSFVTISNQCHTKWNALKRGYENLLRILNG